MIIYPDYCSLMRHSRQNNQCLRRLPLNERSTYIASRQDVPNMRQGSIKDVARLAGVSIATVSRCMNYPEKVSEKTRRKVQQAVVTTGYSPNTLAQSFRRGRTNIVMVVLPRWGPIFSAVMRGIRIAASAQGYSVIFEDTQFNEMTYDDLGTLLVSNQVDGLILLASISPFGNEILSAKTKRLACCNRLRNGIT